jgi:hypothetical protein
VQGRVESRPRRIIFGGPRARRRSGGVAEAMVTNKKRPHLLQGGAMSLMSGGCCRLKAAHMKNGAFSMIRAIWGASSSKPRRVA